MNYRTSHALTLFVLAALTASLAGCGGGGGGGSSSLLSTPTSPTTTPTSPVTIPTTPAPAVLSVSAPALSSFTIMLAQDTASLRAGGSVTYTLTLQNTSASPASIVSDTVSGQSVPKATLRITNDQGAVVYPVQQAGTAHDAPAPPAPPTVTGGDTLAPGASLAPLSRTISAFASPGTYHAQAVFSVAATSSDTPQTVTLPVLDVVVQ